METDPIHDAARPADPQAQSDSLKAARSDERGAEEIVDGRNPTQRKMDERAAKERARQDAAT